MYGVFDRIPLLFRSFHSFNHPSIHPLMFSSHFTRSSVYPFIHSSDSFIRSSTPGRGLAAALSLGCDGAVLGTRLWASEEAMGDGGGVKREALLKAEADDVMRTETFDVLQVSGVSVCVYVYMFVFYVCFVCGCMCACVCEWRGLCVFMCD